MTIRRTIILAIPLLMTGCSQRKITDSVEHGVPCKGEGCGTNPFDDMGQGADRLQMFYSSYFDRPIKPAVDNFLQRYRRDPYDPLLQSWIREFFEPGKQLIGEMFRFNPALNVRVFPDVSAIVGRVKQPTWKEAHAGDEPPSFSSLGADWQQRFESLRWRMAAEATIQVPDAKLVIYRPKFYIHFQGKRKNKTEFTDMGLAGSLYLQISRDLKQRYTSFFRVRYGQTILIEGD